MREEEGREAARVKGEARGKKEGERHKQDEAQEPHVRSQEGSPVHSCQSRKRLITNEAMQQQRRKKKEVWQNLVLIELRSRRKHVKREEGMTGILGVRGNQRFGCSVGSAIQAGSECSEDQETKSRINQEKRLPESRFGAADCDTDSKWKHTQQREKNREGDESQLECMGRKSRLQ